MIDKFRGALQDVIPFTAEVYFRLLQRISETFWPLHIVTLLLGMAALILALKNQHRLAVISMAPLWALVGYGFFIRHYSELNWAGHYMGYGFFAQAILLLALSANGVKPGRQTTQAPAGNTMPGTILQLTGPRVIGLVITVTGLIALPLIAPLHTGVWLQAQVFGIHADPTVVVSWGLSLLLCRGAMLWLVSIIPLLWLLISGLTLLGLDAPGALLLLLLLASGLTALVWHSLKSTAS